MQLEKQKVKKVRTENINRACLKISKMWNFWQLLFNSTKHKKKINKLFEVLKKQAIVAVATKIQCNVCNKH